MRLASRLFGRQTACLAPPTASELLERGLEAARDVVEAATEALDAAPRRSRGRTAVTVAAVATTVLVATAAYVWWKRRDHVGIVDAAPAPAPFVPTPPSAPTPRVASAASVVTPVAVPEPVIAPEPLAIETTPARAEAVAAAPPIAAAPRPAREPQPVEAVADVASLHLGGDCDDARRTIPQPSVASTTSAYSRPPAMSGRFAMPGVRSVVLPGGGGGSLP